MKIMKIFDQAIIDKTKKGATMAEYAIIAAVIITVAILAFTGLGRIIFQKISDLASGF